MRLYWSPQAEDDLCKIDRHVQKRIAEKMRWYAAQKDPLSFAKPLTGQPGIYRYRIGSYRVIVSPEGIIISVLRVHKRPEAYK